MDFSDVLKGLHEGKRYRRAAWKNALFIFLVPGSTFQVNRAPLLGIYPEGTTINYAPHIDVVSNTDGSNNVSTWSPWMGDVMADDWEEYAPAQAEAPVEQTTQFASSGGFAVAGAAVAENATAQQDPEYQAPVDDANVAPQAEPQVAA